MTPTTPPAVRRRSRIPTTTAATPPARMRRKIASSGRRGALLASVAFFLAIHAATASGQPKSFQSCMNAAQTQLQMDTCANIELASADAAEQVLYREVLKVASHRPVGLNEARHAEAAWMEYRDAYVRAMYPARNKLARYGSAYPMEVALLRARLTREHSAQLRDLLEQYSRYR